MKGMNKTITTNQAVEEKQVWGELNLLTEVLAAVYEDAVRLEELLSSVTLPPTVSGETDAAEPCELVPLAAAIREQRWETVEIRDRLESIIQRLEL